MQSKQHEMSEEPQGLSEQPLSEETLREDSLPMHADSSQERLESLQAELVAARHSVSHAHERLRQSNERHAALEAQVYALETSLSHQREKLAALLIENERLGAEYESLASLERRLSFISPNAHAALSQLLAWQQLGMARLAPSLTQAHEQADILWNYVREMSSPGHRLVSFLGKVTSKSYPGRKLKNFLHFLYAIAKSN